MFESDVDHQTVERESIDVGNVVSALTTMHLYQLGGGYRVLGQFIV